MDESAELPPRPSFELTVRCERAVVGMLGAAACATLEHGLTHSLVRACGQLAYPIHAIHIKVIDDTQMSSLHEQFSRVAGTTDVLTFPSNECGAPVDASIAICCDVAARAAIERGHSLERELLLYALHGVLHCAGYDDHDDEAHARMHAEEDRILEAIGVGRTFRADTSSENA